MKVVTVAQMREVELRCQEMGISTQRLMENAGRAVAQEVKGLLGTVAGRSVLALVGPGNNGGDGLVAAKYLSDWGAQMAVYLCAQRRSADPHLKAVVDRGIPVQEAARDDGSFLLQHLESASVVLDAVLGTGRVRPLEGVMQRTLEQVRSARTARRGLRIVALDIPSGLDADAGVADPATLPADFTVTLGCPKAGLFLLPGAEMAGRWTAVDIGIPEAITRFLPIEVMEANTLARMLPRRPLAAHKGTFGRVMVVAGSLNFVGAAYLACQGAARAGAGLVTLAAPRSLHPILAAKLTEATHLPLPEAEPGVVAPEAASHLKEVLESYDVMLIGCGLGTRPATVEFIQRTLLEESLPLALILDADALNALSTVPEWWHRLATQAVLTPHAGEMARLTGLSSAEVQTRRFQIAAESAERWGQVVVLKGAYTLVAAPGQGIQVSPFANPGLASGGTGDVLSGTIAGLVAQGAKSWAASVAGVYLHALAGEMARDDLGDTGMLAEDLLPRLPLAIRKLKES
ncbi:MAG: NAD(P)H-hydrate dehydratase [Chloroflexi bacterium]|nr:NAD(P)H-hydrate dehydratase [Chloroflexota bacterium]